MAMTFKLDTERGLDKFTWSRSLNVIWKKIMAAIWIFAEILKFM